VREEWSGPGYQVVNRSRCPVPAMATSAPSRPPRRRRPTNGQPEGGYLRGTCTSTGIALTWDNATGTRKASTALRARSAVRRASSLSARTRLYRAERGVPPTKADDVGRGRRPRSRP
jgi:hypothetical protein